MEETNKFNNKVFIIKTPLGAILKIVCEDGKEMSCEFENLGHKIYRDRYMFELRHISIYPDSTSPAKGFTIRNTPDFFNTLTEFMIKKEN